MTNAELIVEAQHAEDESQAWNLLPRVTEALQASEAQVARLQANLSWLIDATGAITFGLGGGWPVDLLEAVQALYYGADHEHVQNVAICSLCKARVTLTRYGLLEGEAK